MKGIILAGGSGNRLYPMTQVLSKQLQPIYDKPMIFYPLSMLMLAGIKDVLIISTKKDTPFIKNLLGDGSEFGIKLCYEIQESPKGISEAFIIGEQFIEGDDVTLILGDNLFYGNLDFLKNAIRSQTIGKGTIKARIFGYFVNEPTRFGVIDFDESTGEIFSIEEKPKNPKSNYAIPGIYIFDQTAAEKAKKIEYSQRGELEITALIEMYWKELALGVHTIGRGVTWLDTGTPQSLLDASILISSIEKRQGLKFACLHEIALKKDFISVEQYIKIVEVMPNSSYRDYLIKILEKKPQTSRVLKTKKIQEVTNELC